MADTSLRFLTSNGPTRSSPARSLKRRPIVTAATAKVVEGARYFIQFRKHHGTTETGLAWRLCGGCSHTHRFPFNVNATTTWCNRRQLKAPLSIELYLLCHHETANLVSSCRVHNAVGAVIVHTSLARQFPITPQVRVQHSKPWLNTPSITLHPSNLVAFPPRHSFE